MKKKLLIVFSLSLIFLFIIFVKCNELKSEKYVFEMLFNLNFLIVFMFNLDFGSFVLSLIIKKDIEKKWDFIFRDSLIGLDIILKESYKS